AAPDPQADERRPDAIHHLIELAPRPTQAQARKDESIAIAMRRGRAIQDTADRLIGDPGEWRFDVSGHEWSPSSDSRFPMTWFSAADGRGTEPPPTRGPRPVYL